MAEIISKLKDYKIGLLLPKDIIKGSLEIHHEKLNNINLHSYFTIQPPKISSEWPVPLNPMILVKIFKVLKNYDIIHLWVPFYIINTLIIILKSIFFPNKKLILTMDTIPGVSFKINKISDLLFRIYYKTFGKIIFSKTQYITLYGDSFIKYALAAGISEKKIKVLPTGIANKLKKKDKNIKKEFNINKNDKIILYIGIINERKGVDKIIEVAKLLNESNLKYIIVGDGQARNKIEKLIKINNLKNQIIITGFRKDVHNFYKESNVFILPSIGEGLSGVLMESMLYGVPIITTNIPGNRDLINNNFNGFLCEFNDIKCFTKRIKELLKDEILCKKFVRNSKQVLNENFLWKNNIKKYLKLYKEI